MMYPRLKVARDLLTEDGVIFISIDDNEVENLKKICDEIFGEQNFVATVNWKGRGGRQDSKHFAALHEYVLVYAKNLGSFVAGEQIKESDNYPKFDERKGRYYKTQLLRKWGSNSLRSDRPNLYYSIKAPDGSEVFPMIYSKTDDTTIEGCWRWGKSRMIKAIGDGIIEFKKDEFGHWIPYEKVYAPKEGEDITMKYSTWIDEANNGSSIITDLLGKGVFNYPKSPILIERFLRMSNLQKDSIILDFFSGSGTTAHAVMQLNAEDGGNRKFIMVQLPELTDEKSEAYKAGYKTICEIGKERIRRAGKKIKEEQALMSGNLDTGFRVLKLADSNLVDVERTPSETTQSTLFEGKVKVDRNAEDFLLQSMLQLGIELSASIEERTLQGKRVFFVNHNQLAACFDAELNEELIKEIAAAHPRYFVMYDASITADYVLDNFEQLFMHYSPNTQCFTL